MASELFQSFGGTDVAKNATNPREQAMSLLKQRGISIPEGIADNPQAIIQHLMQSGAVPQNRLAMAQQMLSRMFKR